MKSTDCGHALTANFCDVIGEQRTQDFHRFTAANLRHRALGRAANAASIITHERTQPCQSIAHIQFAQCANDLDPSLCVRIVESLNQGSPNIGSTDAAGGANGCDEHLLLCRLPDYLAESRRELRVFELAEHLNDSFAQFRNGFALEPGA